MARENSFFDKVNVSFGAHSTFAPVVLLMSATLALFFRFLDPQGHQVLSLYGEDLTGQFVWWRKFGFEELLKGNLALWNPRLFCGEPFFGGFQSALLYPPNWLFLFLPLGFALNLSIILHVFLAGWFTLLWIKGRGGSLSSGFMASFMFMFGAAYFLHVVPGHLPNLCTMVWIPLIFLALDKYRNDTSAKWISLGAAALAMQIFSGHIQYVYYTALVAGLYALSGLGGAANKARYFLGTAAMFAAAGLLAAVQLGAGWAAAWESARSGRLSMDIMDTADMTLERLWCLLMPGFFGGWKDYWGGGIYWEGAMYVGTTAFVFALFALKESDQRQKKFFAVLALFLTLLAVGKRMPLFPFFCDYFPLFGNFRGVGKLNIFITICLIALAAMGMDEIYRKPEKLKGLARGAGAGALLAAMLGLVFWILPVMGAERVFKQFINHVPQMVQSLLSCAVLLAAIAALAVLGRNRPMVRHGFTVLCFLELFFFARANLPSFDMKALEAEVSGIQKIYDQDPGDYRILAEGCNMTLGTTGFDIWGEDPTTPLRYARFAAASQHFTVENDILRKTFFREFPPSLGLLRLRVVLRQQEGSREAKKTGLAEMPRALFLDQWEILKTDEIGNRVLNQEFKPFQTVLLESDPGIPQVNGILNAELRVKDLSTDQVEIKARLSKPAVLLMTDNYSQYWKAGDLSGNHSRVYRVLPANGFQKAVPLTAGEHHLVLEYRPWAYDVGKWISLISWILFLAGMAWKSIKN
jgi:hypothetical protein